MTSSLKVGFLKLVCSSWHCGSLHAMYMYVHIIYVKATLLCFGHFQFASFLVYSHWIPESVSTVKEGERENTVDWSAVLRKTLNLIVRMEEDR